MDSRIELNIRMLNGNNLHYGEFVKTENNLRYQLVRKDGVITYNQFTEGQVQFIVNGLSKKCRHPKRGLSWYCKQSMAMDSKGNVVDKKDYIYTKFNPYKDLWQVIDVNRTSGKVKAVCEDFEKIGNMKVAYFESEKFEIVDVARIKKNAVEIANELKADRDSLKALNIIQGKCLRIVYRNMEGRVNTSTKYLWLEPSYFLIKNSLVVDKIYIQEIITKIGAK